MLCAKPTHRKVRDEWGTRRTPPARRSPLTYNNLLTRKRWTLICPHCLTAYNVGATLAPLGNDKDGAWQASWTLCPECKIVIFLLLTKAGQRAVPVALVYPKGTSRKPPAPEVPKPFCNDYKEACLVLDDSPKASAALSRRCLQAILREHAKTKSRDLADQIDEVLAGNLLPSHLAGAIDAVRHIAISAPILLRAKAGGNCQRRAGRSRVVARNARRPLRLLLRPTGGAQEERRAQRQAGSCRKAATQIAPPPPLANTARSGTPHPDMCAARPLAKGGPAPKRLGGSVSRRAFPQGLRSCCRLFQLGNFFQRQAAELSRRNVER